MNRFNLKTLLAALLIVLAPFVASGREDLDPFYPNDPYFFYNATARPYFPGQWHLVNQAPSSISFRSVQSGTTTLMVNSGIDAGLLGAWSLGYTGKGVVIGIVDDGVDGGNYDIAPNYRADLSRNFSDNASIANSPQGPQKIGDNHGTSVAGVAAARGGNGIGGTGAAPYAQIAGLRLNETATAGDPVSSEQNVLDAYYWKSGVNPTTGTIEGVSEIQVKNHSYSSEVPFAGQSAAVTLALKRTAANGVIHVFAAGNERGTKTEDANRDADHDNSSVITVAALGSDGKYTNYSNFGSSIFVTAPSNRSDYTGFGITTTDRTGAGLGYNAYSATNTSGDRDDLFPDTSYASGFGGTSSSTPLVSGIMALGKEANPEMEIRMAKHALVKTSTVVDASDTSDSSFGGWRKNGAGNRFNPNYGFGNINAGAFVQKVHNVAYVTEQTSVTKSAAFSLAIPDDDPAGVSQTFNLTAAEANQHLEGVEVGLTLTHAKAGDLTATITSPSTMASKILYSTSHLDPAQQDTTSFTNKSWTFLTNAFWGENGTGTWTLNVADIDAGNTGTWLGYNVTFLMGEMVMLTPGTMIQGVDINALSLTVMNSATTYLIPAGRTFQVSRNVIVDGGTLIVNGQLTEAAGSFGNLFRLYSGTVGGTGTIHASRGLYNTGGTVSPGNSIGTLTLAGSYTQAAAGKLLIEVASPTSNDLLAITGSASLNGVLQTSWLGGATPAIGTVFGTFLTAATGVTGQFTSLLTNIMPTVVFKPKYDVANQVYLVVERDYMNQVLIAYLNANQRSVGTMLNSVAPSATGDLDTVLDAIDAIPTYGQVAHAYDQIAPKESEAAFSMGISGIIFQSGNISERLSDIRRGVRGTNPGGAVFRNNGFIRDGKDKPLLIASTGSDLTGMLPGVEDEKWGIFVKGNAISGDQRDTSDQVGYGFTSAGMTVGIDYRFTNNLAAGLLLGYTGSRADIDDFGSKVKMDGYTLGVYGTWYTKGFFVDGQAGYGWSDYKNTRRIVFPGLDRSASSSPTGRQFTLYGGTGYELNINKWMIVPTLSLQYIKLDIDGYTESGAGALSLNVDRQKAESLQGNIGGKLYYTWETGKGVIMPGIRASYGREFLRDSRNIISRLAQGSSPFSIETPSPDRNFLLCGAGVSMFMNNGLSFQIGYDAQLGESSYIAHSVNAVARMVF
ncbi:MAG TPA: autotransporter domain-containing protein [Syntrophorhabdaceae bacterium]|nr:autotransporter domain-containing protein [Syntrophorhabdaceae bacterium]